MVFAPYNGAGTVLRCQVKLGIHRLFIDASIVLARSSSVLRSNSDTPRTLMTHIGVVNVEEFHSAMSSQTIFANFKGP